MGTARTRAIASAAWVWIAMLTVVAVLLLVVMNSGGDAGPDPSALPACTATSGYPCRDGVGIVDRFEDGSVQRFTEADWRDRFGGGDGPAWDELAH
jgi:hypothetical protein